MERQFEEAGHRLDQHFQKIQERFDKIEGKALDVPPLLYRHDQLEERVKEQEDDAVTFV